MAQRRKQICSYKDRNIAQLEPQKPCRVGSVQPRRKDMPGQEVSLFCCRIHIAITFPSLDYKRVYLLHEKTMPLRRKNTH